MLVSWQALPVTPISSQAWPFAVRRAEPASGSLAADDGAILALMPGRVIAVVFELGSCVPKGDGLLVLDAMKMEQALLAPFNGNVAELKVREGAQVSEGNMLNRIEGIA